MASASMMPLELCLIVLTAAAPVKVSTPLTLVATTLADAHLVNVSPDVQRVLHTVRFQPSRLKISKNGVEVAAEDERAREKYDNTVLRGNFQDVAPGGTFELFEEKIRAHGAVTELQWGPFSFVLEPGEYDVVIEWESKQVDFVNDAKKLTKLDHVWRGTLRSEKFKLKVP